MIPLLNPPTEGAFKPPLPSKQNKRPSVQPLAFLPAIPDNPIWLGVRYYTS